MSSYDIDFIEQILENLLPDNQYNIHLLLDLKDEYKDDNTNVNLIVAIFIVKCKLCDQNIENIEFILYTLNKKYEYYKKNRSFPAELESTTLNDLNTIYQLSSNYTDDEFNSSELNNYITELKCDDSIAYIGHIIANNSIDEKLKEKLIIAGKDDVIDFGNKYFNMIQNCILFN